MRCYQDGDLIEGFELLASIGIYSGEMNPLYPPTCDLPHILSTPNELSHGNHLSIYVQPFSVGKTSKIGGRQNSPTICVPYYIRGGFALYDGKHLVLLSMYLHTNDIISIHIYWVSLVHNLGASEIGTTADENLTPLPCTSNVVHQMRVCS